MPTYTGTTTKDLDNTTPTAGSWQVPEADDALREIKTVYKNNEAIASTAVGLTLTANHSVIICTAACTITLPTPSTVASASYRKEYTIISTTTGTVTISGAVSGETNPTITTQYGSLIICTDGTSWFYKNYGKALTAVSATTATQLTDGTNNIKTKIINIGDWNCTSTATVNVAHGLTLANIRSVSATIRNDADDTYYPLTPGYITTPAEVDGYIVGITASNVVLDIKSTGFFNSTDFNSTSYNRGFVVVTYVA